MKRILTLLIPVIVLSGCEKINELTQFEIETTSNFTVPATVAVNTPFIITTPPIETNASSTFKNEGTRADLIEEISLTDCVLTITSPTSSNFDFLSDIEVFITAANETDVRIAYKSNIINGIGSVLELNTTGADLKNFLTKDSYGLRIRTVTDELPGDDIDIEVQNIFFVDARLL